MPSLREFRFSALSVEVAVRCRDAAPLSMVAAGYRSLGNGHGRAHLTYEISGRRGRRGWRRLTRDGRGWRARDEQELLQRLDADLAIELQRRRRDLLFLHAAVLVRNGGAVLVVGASGVGKSTTAWALAHHGFAYAGDELAPLEPARSRVVPFPRALVLKQSPPPAYPLPGDACALGRGWRVPVHLMPAGFRTRPLRVDAAFFPRRELVPGRPRLLSAAEAAVRLYANALNPLAHPVSGLDVAVTLARGLPAFEVSTASLRRACAAIVSCLERLPPRTGE